MVEVEPGCKGRTSSTTCGRRARPPTRKRRRRPACGRSWPACGCASCVRRRRSASPIVPDGCGDLMVYDDVPPLVAGPDATTRWVTFDGGTVIVGARFRAGDPGRLRLSGDHAPRPCRPAVGSDGHRDRPARAAAPRPERPPTAAPPHRVDSSGARWPVAGRLPRACRLPGAHRRSAAGHRHARGSVRLERPHHHRDFLGACGYGPNHFQRIMPESSGRSARRTIRRARTSSVARPAMPIRRT